MKKIGEFMMGIDEYFQNVSLCHLSRCCDLIKMDFKSDDRIICLHIQCSLVRIVKENVLLVSSNDIYLPGKKYKKKLFKKFKWDMPENTLYDDQISEYRAELLNKKVEYACFSGKDLVLKLENGYKIEVIDSTLEKEQELFRVFIKGDLNSHNVIET